MGESTVSRLLTQFNSTPLHLAAGYNRVGLVELLLSKGADVHAKDKGGLVPLHNACSFGHVEVVKLLLKAGAGVNEEDLWKFTPLHEAISKGRMAVWFAAFLPFRDFFRCRNGDFSVEMKIPPSMWLSLGRREKELAPDQLVCTKIEVALLLMLHGADYFRKNASGKSPIELAPNEAFRKQLLNDFYGCRIYDAAANCDVSALRNLLTERDANFIHPFKMEYPLHAVARAKHLQRAVIAEMLINKGCPLDRYNNKSMTPLHLAVQNGLLDVARVLLKAWAAVDKLTSDGRTILHIAAANGDIEMCE
ncbi:Tankyrase-1 [Toxocara canis]|uniref:Tankyrase-1 n=1 Tax=Toxocara canis TaxID=6265 RepID=A0A0B2USY1_TOXCA|nr:Tankyrase-1 [Toxocara canis]